MSEEKVKILIEDKASDPEEVESNEEAEISAKDVTNKKKKKKKRSKGEESRRQSFSRNSHCTCT